MHKQKTLNNDLLCQIAYSYYLELYPRLKGKSGWQSVCCPFHDDKNPSLRLSLEHGGFKCHGCGASGTLAQFHMRKQYLSYQDSLNDLKQKVK